MCRLGHGPIHPVLGVFTIICWGPNASSDMLRQRVRYSGCGSKGAILQYRAGSGRRSG